MLSLSSSHSCLSPLVTRFPSLCSSSADSMAPSLHCHLLLLFSTIAVAVSKTFPGDVEALKSIKQSIDQASIPPGSCLSSWDFAAGVDPCDASFTDRFTCGIRCDARTGDLSRVTEIALDPAGYAGPLSPSVWSLPFLETLHLADNRFSGSFPSPPPSSSLTPLRRLTLSRNSFSGGIPDLSPAAASLEEAYLDSNFFSGTINASNLDRLRLLRRLEIQNNNLTGEIPDLASLSSLNYLDASGNALVGGFPSDGGLPPSLLEISLRSNRLTGELPGPAIAALQSLQVLDASHNGLWGGVPKDVFEHPALEQLTLSYNRFEWIEAPSNGGVGVSQLVALDLGGNGLTGLLPGFIGSMPRLSAVDLRDNRFRGMIPAQYAVRAAGMAVEEGVAQFERLLLSGNYLFGPIPGAMVAMKEGSAVVSLADNCLFRCPAVFFFCQDGQQKPASTCREFNPVIP